MEQGHEIAAEVWPSCKTPRSGGPGLSESSISCNLLAKAWRNNAFGLDFRENAWKFAETHSTLESRLGFEAIFGSYARKGLYDRHVRGLQGEPRCEERRFDR